MNTKLISKAGMVPEGDKFNSYKWTIILLMMAVVLVLKESPCYDNNNDDVTATCMFFAMHKPYYNFYYNH